MVHYICMTDDERLFGDILAKILYLIAEIDFNKLSGRLMDAFELILPDKCRFEKE